MEGERNHEIPRDGHKKMMQGSMMQDTSLGMRHASCIFNGFLVKICVILWLIKKRR